MLVILPSLPEGDFRRAVSLRKEFYFRRTNTTQTNGNILQYHYDKL